MNHLAHEGLIDTSIGGYWGNAPKMVSLALENKVKGYNFPQGVLGHLMRAIASGKPGIITPIGLYTYVDPRLEGGKLNDITLKPRRKINQFYPGTGLSGTHDVGTDIDISINQTGIIFTVMRCLVSPKKNMVAFIYRCGVRAIDAFHIYHVGIQYTGFW